MDAVITYVNSEDKFWREEYKKHVKGVIEEVRYRDLGTLRYLIDGIHEFMPFIEHTYLVVSSPSQIVDIDTSDVDVIYHKDIIPEKYLPCFNSCTIEMFLHKIPGLSEEFIYFNDDTFVLKPMKKTDFFIDGKPVLNPHLSKCSQFDKLCTFAQQCKNSTELIRSKFVKKYPNNVYIRQEHIMRPMLKSTCEIVWEKCEKEILNSLTRIRTKRNYNVYLFNDYDVMTGGYVQNEIAHKYLKTNESVENITSNISSDKFSVVCINDNGAVQGKDKLAINTAFNNVLLKHAPVNLNTYNKETNQDIIRYNNKLNYGVSVCLTAFRTEKYIEECLDSIEKQTYFKTHDNYEVILVIDHCYETLEKVKSIMHKYTNLIVLMLNENVGTYIASNTAMSIAKYDWLIRFDSDDVMNENMIETIMKNTHNCDIVQYKLKSFSTDGTKFVEFTDYGKGSIAIKKNIFNQYGGYRPWICSGDYELLTRLSNLTINKIDEQLYGYRRTQTSLTKNSKTNGKSTLRKEYNEFVSQEKNNPNIERVIECKTAKFTVITEDTVVVNVTTYPARDKFLYKALDYFKNQTLKPTKIILWLAKDEYEENNLPDTILNCLNDGLLTDIMFTYKNIYCHKRHECFKYFNYAFNIFIDDDIYYPVDFVKDLVHYSKIYNLPTSYFGKNMEYTGTTWNMNAFNSEPDLKNRYYGGLSCIPPYMFPMESLNYEKERDIVCPKCDESWLQMWFIKNDIKVYNINEWKLGASPFRLVEDSQQVSMWNENKQVKNGILKKVNNIARCVAFLNIEDKAHMLWPNFDIVKSCDGEYEKIKEMSLK